MSMWDSLVGIRKNVHLDCYGSCHRGEEVFVMEMGVFGVIIRFDSAQGHCRQGFRLES